MNHLIFSVVLSLFTSSTCFSRFPERKLHINKSVVKDSSNICGKWLLTRTINKSEKTIYEDNESSTLSLNCDSRQWVIKSDNGFFSSGRWRFKNEEHQLVLESENEELVFEIVKINKKELILLLDSNEMHYTK